MLFFARMDESDTHGDAPDMLMAAMLGTGAQWEVARRRLRALKRQYGFTVFHAVDFRHQRGEFKGWSEQKCRDILTDFGRLVRECLTEVVTVTLPYRVYKERFLDVRPQKLHQTSQYGFCFEALLFTCMRRILDMRGSHRLSVIVECGHPNASDTARIFAKRKAQLEAQGNSFLRTHTLASKGDDELLMLADAAAHGKALHERAIRKGEALANKDRPKEIVPKNEVGWTMNEVTPEYLDMAIKEFHDERAAKERAYLSRKRAHEAKKASGRQSS